ncbi:MAG: transcriptional repressor, partial [Burkholderiales bacterium]|nr:transcriptional repressor [Burkholderiales bacterium]
IYELNNSLEHHDHLICSKCATVVEFSNQQIEDLQMTIAQLNNFQVLSHTLNIYGICEKCNTKTE